MNTLKISVHGFDLTDSIREYAEEKFSKILIHDKNVDDLNVTLEVGAKFDHHKIKTFVVKANMNFHKNHIHVEHEGSNLYSAINDVEKKLLREIRKEHRRFKHERRT